MSTENAAAIRSFVENESCPVPGLSLAIAVNPQGVYTIIMSNAELERVSAEDRRRVWVWASTIAQRIKLRYGITVGVGRQ